MSRGCVRFLASLIVVTISLGVGNLPGAFAADTTPKQWDERIAPIAKAAEQIRGLKFEHPVPVRFLTDSAFRKRVTSDRDKLTKKDKGEIKTVTETLRAFGLLPGNVDLFDAVNTAKGDGVLAYYSPEDKEVVVRGKGPIDAPTRATLAHELTHVLQDQHFDLQKLERADAKAHPDSGALKALIEGDANWVEDKYVGEMNDADQKAYLDSTTAAGPSSSGDVPGIVQFILGAPYELGPYMIDALRATGGRAAVDDAFRTPPTNEAQMLDPAKLVLDTTARTVAAPKVGPGEHRIGGSEEFGALSLYIMLASRIPPADAFAAADGWAGDRQITLRKHGKTCARVAVEGRTGADTTRIRTALDAWAAAMPAGTASTRPRADGVDLTSCDPGTGVPGPSDEKLTEAQILLSERNESLVEVLAQKASPALATCFANGLSAEPLFTQLVVQADTSFSQLDPAAQQRLRDVATGVATRCRSTTS
jgi:hypothetical protein